MSKDIVWRCEECGLEFKEPSKTEEGIACCPKCRSEKFVESCEVDTKKSRAERIREKKAKDKEFQYEASRKAFEEKVSMTQEIVDKYVKAFPEKAPFIVNREKSEVYCPCGEVHKIHKNAKRQKVLVCQTFGVSV